MANTRLQPPAAQHDGQARNSFTASRPMVISIVKLLLFSIASLPMMSVRAAPTRRGLFGTLADDEEPPMSTAAPTLWIYLAVAVALVLLGGAFAGLTIALMGQDEIYLQVIRTSGEGSERNHAAKVLRLLKRGKHWVLVTLLLGNVITNETLPIVLDRSLGGGWPAVLGSTVLIVIFGEIIPQSICVRYGLPIGAWMSPLVLILMYIMAPVAWPTAKLLDWLLGEDHGTTYKKAGLKTLVTLHRTLGEAGEQLNSDEVTIISAVLDLKAKPIGSIMTPMADVFTMSADTVLDEQTMDIILGAGYSRIPIFAPDNELNFVGMLLVKILITYDPEDCKRVRDFALATLPETRAETSCLDIVNFFQEGKSHMVLVSENPGEDHGALGVVTLEDVIEELIGEEIVDESDVYVDVHKAIRRNMPAPKYRVPKGEIITAANKDMGDGEENLIDLGEEQKDQPPELQRMLTPDGVNKVKANGNQAPSVRRTSSIADLPKKDNRDRDQLKNLGPSNLASRPRQTRYNTVKIKPGGGTLNEALAQSSFQAQPSEPPRDSENAAIAAQGGVGTGVLNPAGKDAKDGVAALQAGYGTMGDSSPPPLSKGRDSAPENKLSISPKQTRDQEKDDQRATSADRGRASSQGSAVGPRRSVSRSKSKKGVARSGSLSENVFTAGGIKKTVLEPSSSSDDTEGGGLGSAQYDGASDREGVKLASSEGASESQGQGQSQSQKKKRRRRKRSKKGEDQPLMEEDDDQ